MLPQRMTPRQRAGFHAETLDGEVILLHPARELLVHSNETGALIWKLCDGRRSVGQIVALLSEAYPESADEIAAEVPAVLASLARHGALEWA